MDCKEACQIILSQSGFKYQLGTSVTDSGIASSVYDYGRFYGVAEGQKLGAGQIYSGLRYPVFDEADYLFNTIEGVAIVLSHECDISQDNHRPFNDTALICPIIPLDVFFDFFSGELDQDRLKGLFSDLGKDRIYRLMYLPPINGFLESGGVIYLNQVSHTHVKSFVLEGVNLITSVSDYGLRALDHKLINHLFRPKSTPMSRFC